MQTEIHRPITDFIRDQRPRIRESWTLAETIDHIRLEAATSGALYLYVLDKEDSLKGILSVRSLLVGSPEQLVRDTMTKQVISLSVESNLMDACEYFALHRYLAFPVVDAGNKFLGVVDVHVFADEILEISEQEQVDEIFESIGVRLELMQKVSTVKSFGLRFPWIMVTVTVGMLCAFVTGAFAETLEKSVVLAFFITLALGLGESLSIQAMTTTIHRLRGARPTLAGFRAHLYRELKASALLALSSSTIVGSVLWLWQGKGPATIAIPLSIFTSMIMASLVGLGVPNLLHLWKLDLKISSGPITLALADLSTVFLYFGIATICFT